MPEMSEELDQIAVVGMAGRFPGAPDVDSFWRNLEEGRESIEVLSEAGLRAAGVDPEVSGRDGYVPAKGVLAGADRFDAAFFGYNPREAEIMDPQHRVFLECAWEALESAGCVPEDFEGRIGVFAGAGMNTYLLHNVTANRRVFESAGPYQTLLASDKDFLATRVAYKLGLTGPAMSVQTACSTSLTAVHLACQSLLNGECDLALAGGVSIGSPLEQGYQYEPGGILSPDGHCRPFDASAGGTVPGNGVGVVVLRRLADARRDGDPVDAVVLGSAVNNDGALKAGYTAPSVDGQAAVVSEALAMAGVGAGSVGYVETHGTGTALGDPIELAALTRAFREDTEETGYCAIGSVKSNIGHLDAAAGVAALIKTVLALRHEAIPASLHFTKPNPELDLESGPFFVNDRLRPWPRGERPRRAGVSSFGIGGTNVHLVLEEAPAPAPEPEPAAADAAAAETSPVLLPLSGRTAEAVAEGARRLADHLEAHPGLRLDDLAHTLTHHRRAFGRRAAPVAPDRAGAVAALRAVTAAGTREAAEGARVAFLFPGQGTQYVDMARGLYRREPVFTAELDRCAELFAAELGEDPRDLLFPAPEQAEAAAERLTRTEYAQPALFLVEYALAQQWAAWGVRPDAMVGHSVGEYVAACLAGVFELADTVRLVAARGRLVAAMPTGSMLTVFLSERELAPWLAESADSADSADSAEDSGLAVAALNSTGLSVVSGPTDAVDALERRLKEAAVPCRRLHTSHGFHSPAMDGAVGPLVEAVRAVRPNPPRIPFCSNVTGTWITEQEATDPEYWGRHLRQPVRFADAAALLLADPSWVLLEVGPGHTLGDFVRRHGSWQEGRTVVGSLRHPQGREDDALLLRRSLGALWSAGVPVDRDVLRPGADGQVLRLPGYAFQRQRYWVEPDRAATTGTGPAATGGTTTAGPVPVEDWFRTPGWRRLAPHTGSDARTGSDGGPLWVVLGDGTGLGAALAERLAEGGAAVVRVGTADDSERTDGLRVPGPHARGANSWSLDPDDRAQAAELLGALDLRGAASLRLVHLFSLGDDLSDTDVLDGEALDEARLTAARRLGPDSLAALAQALTDARPAVPVTLDVLCRGVHSVTGEEPLRPEQALLAGPCTVIPQELPDVDCRLLDITGTDPAAPAEDAVGAVHALLRRDPGERELALRGRHWWVRDFDPLPLPAGDASADSAEADGTAEADGPADPPAHARDGGVYLVTGGLGGVGLALAEQLAEGVRAPVLGLLGRSDFPAEEDWPAWLAEHGEQDPTGARIRRLTRLRERGARIALLRADVTDERELGAALAALRARFGPLNGVVHAAGAPSTGMLARRTRADADAVLAAKTVGTLLLDRLCADDPLDFLLLCSSVSAVLGGPGQSDYGAANAFLDAFAHWRRRQGRPVTALGWGTWEGVGMAAGLTGRATAAGPETGHPLLRPVRAEGTTVVFETVLSTADSWIVDDHRLMGHGLVPGTAYLELVRAALAGQAGEREIELHDVLFMTPVVVPDGQHRTVFTTIEERDGRPHFTVRSRPAPDAPWREHATGSASFHGRGPDVVRDLAEVLERCEVTEVLETEEEIRRRLGVERFEEGGGPLRFWFGPRWQVLKTIRTGGRRMLATLRLDEAFLADLADYPLHPALLDMAGGVFRLHAEDPYYLPLTYRSLRILHPLTGTVEVAVEIKHPAGSTGETLTCDLELLDPDGRLLVQVTDFTVKRINDVEALLTQIGQTVAEAEAAGADTGTGTGAESTGTGSTGALAALAEGFGEPEGRAAFARVLAQPELPAHLVVTPQDFTALRRLARSITPALLARELEQLAPLGGSHPRPELATPFVAPATEREEAVAALWREVLGVEEVGVHDDFFALGGHSLAAVQINTRIRSRFGTELDLRDFFQSPTVAHTVDLLAGGGATGGGDGDTIEALSRTGDGGGPGHEDLDDHDLDDHEDSLDDLDGLSDEEVEARLQALLAEEAAEETTDRGNQE
ncbi:SDR family NAD(P)-dependent oxidoreductase [Kitasatospora purpeofusca]|uniref:type I polyketide synthase n=1 Tax=Kitasatospora purpeofusca TaxID=67352 RepID=UPI0030F25D21